MNKQQKGAKVLDVTSGPMFKKMILFAIPIMLSGMLQQTFTTTDSIIIGRYAGSNALGGVTSTISLVNLLIGLFSGISTGGAIAISQAMGAKDFQKAGRYAHNAIAISLAGGIAVGIIGILLCEPVLRAMGSPDEIFPYSVKYMKIYFAGAPFQLLYNFGSAIMRTTGDTKRPLLFLCIGGVTNIFLNMLFVICFGMDTDGVATATVMANIISSSLVMHNLCHSTHCCAISLRKLEFNPAAVGRIITLGVPAGVQMAMFSLSNVVLQSAFNSFGPQVVAGNGAASNIEMYAGFTADGINQAAMTFTGQNVGAGKFRRVMTVFWQGVMSSVIVMAVIATFMNVFRYQLLSLFITDSPEAINAGSMRITTIMYFEIIMAVMNISSSVLRGMGKSFIPMVISIFGVCVLRLVWILGIFPHIGTLFSLYLVYPITWSFTAVVLTAMMFYQYRCLFTKRQNVIAKI